MKLLRWQRLGLLVWLFVLPYAWQGDLTAANQVWALTVAWVSLAVPEWRLL